MELIINKILNILQKNNISVYSLAKKTHISQSTLHKILHLERPMQSKYFFSIIENLPFSLTQKQSITEEFMKISLGEEKYYANHSIIKIIKDFYNISFFSPENCLNPPKALAKNSQDQVDVYKGNAIAQEISMALIQEMNMPNPKAYVYIPGYSTDICTYIDNVVKLYNTSINISFIVDFLNANSPNWLNNNLNILKNIVPLALADEKNYSFYYNYVGSINTGVYITPYPYFIALSSKIIYINYELNEILVINSIAAVKSVISMCEAKITKCEKFIKGSSDMVSAMKNILNCETSDDSFYSIEYEPNMLLFATPEMLRNIINEDLEYKEFIINEIIKRNKSINSMSKYIKIFNKDSIMEFAQSGKIKNYPEAFTRICTKEERLYFLNCILNNMDSKNIILRAANPDYINITEMHSIILKNKSFINLSIYNSISGDMNYLLIPENALGSYFYDFLENIINTYSVNSAEKTKELVKKAIKYAEAL